MKYSFVDQLNVINRFKCTELQLNVSSVAILLSKLDNNQIVQDPIEIELDVILLERKNLNGGKWMKQRCQFYPDLSNEGQRANNEAIIWNIHFQRTNNFKEGDRERERKKRNKLLRKKNIWKLESLGAAGRRHSGAIRPLFSLHTSHSFHSFHLEGPRIPKNPKRSQTT